MVAVYDHNLIRPSNIPFTPTSHTSSLSIMATSTPRPTQAPPLFRALASSTRPIQQMLKCINFTNKVHVEITEELIKFAADQSRVTQGKSVTIGV